MASIRVVHKQISLRPSAFVQGGAEILIMQSPHRDAMPGTMLPRPKIPIRDRERPERRTKIIDA